MVDQHNIKILQNEFPAIRDVNSSQSFNKQRMTSNEKKLV
jgi:hypothetical protein